MEFTGRTENVSTTDVVLRVVTAHLPVSIELSFVLNGMTHGADA